MLIVNDTMFAHGGVLMGHVQYGLERINAEVAAWMRGDRLIDGSRAPPPFLAMGCGPHSMSNHIVKDCPASAVHNYIIAQVSLDSVGLNVLTGALDVFSGFLTLQFDGMYDLAGC